MSHDAHDAPPTDADLTLATQVRTHLRACAADTLPLTYKALAKALDLQPPHTIHRVTTALECLMREDVAAGVPMIAALVTSRWRGGLPAPGFFVLAHSLGRYDGEAEGAAAEAFHRREFDAALAYWVKAAR